MLITKVKDQIKVEGETSIIHLVETLIEEADRLRASDIHIDPLTENIRVRFRIDGVLQDLEPLPKAIHNEVISRIKILSHLRTDEHQAAQDGRFRYESKGLDGKTIDIRVSIAPTYHGENAVMRLLTDQAGQFKLGSLGFNPANEQKILAAISKPHGMILVTGPTGSGKTTTLYTLIKMLNTSEVSIITIEDPIEYAISGVEQVQVNPRTGLTFASGLRSFLRQDPDIIMVGEIRDAETASLAVNTALTGHLLLSTLHTNDAATTLPRLLDMGVEPFLAASTINLAIGQRLVRKICEECKVKRALTSAERKSLSEVISSGYFTGTEEFRFGKGCNACGGTGFQGRLGIHEVLPVDADIREAILRKAPASEISRLAKKNGMWPMLLDGLDKAKAGLTTVEEVVRVTHD